MQQAIARHRPAIERTEPLTPYERLMQRVVQGGIAFTITGMVLFFHAPLMHAMGSMLP